MLLPGVPTQRAASPCALLDRRAHLDVAVVLHLLHDAGHAVVRELIDVGLAVAGAQVGLGGLVAALKVNDGPVQGCRAAVGAPARQHVSCVALASSGVGDPARAAARRWSSARQPQACC